MLSKSMARCSTANVKAPQAIYESIITFTRTQSQVEEMRTGVSKLQIDVPGFAMP